MIYFIGATGTPRLHLALFSLTLSIRRDRPVALASRVCAHRHEQRKEPDYINTKTVLVRSAPISLLT